MSHRDELARLRDELEALRLANGALEQQMLAGAEQTDAMLRQVESQRNALRDAHQRERGLAAFAERVMDAVSSLVIVLGADGRITMANHDCCQRLGEAEAELSQRVLDEWLHPDEHRALAEQLPELPWAVHSVLFETVRRQSGYSAEHRLMDSEGDYRHYLVSAVMLYSLQGKEEGAVVSAADITAIKQQEKRLLASELRLNEAQQIAHVGSWELDLVSDELHWSPEVFRIFEIDPEQFGASYDAFLALLHPDDRQKVSKAYRQAVKAREDYDIVHRLLFPNGRIKWVNERCITRYGENGTPLRSLGTVQDVTVRKKAEDEIRLAASVFDNSLNGILIVEPDGTIRGVNHAFTEILGYSAEEVVGQLPSLMKSGHHDELFYQEMWGSLLKESKWEGEIWDRRKDGEVIPVWQSISAVRDARGEITHYIGILYDISEQKASAERIQHLAHYDVLTGLPNRALLLDRAEHAVARARRERGVFALLFLDLDRFKHINDTLGHPVGDDLLQAVAQRLQQTLREQDTVARLGGDEFIVLLEDIDNDQDARVAAEKILAAFTRPFVVGSQTLSVGTTIGISLYPEHGEDVTSLLMHADMALYQAKEHGRGCFWFFENQLTEQTTERMHLEHDLRQAIQQGELELHYQPIYSLGDQRLVGAEALLRWHHPGRGLISPDIFIPIARDTGLIIPIGVWVLEQACQQVRSWRDQGLDLQSVAVNLSAVEIQRGDILATVSRALEQAGLPAHCLELEITESEVMRHTERDLQQLQALHDMGVELAIDDFGTGQYSLGYLKNLPINKIKIDRSFVEDTGDDASGAAITRAILGLGQGLNMTVVAEGVETQGQEQFLRKLNCDQVQGFRYNRPMDATAFTALLQPEIKKASS